MYTKFIGTVAVPEGSEVFDIVHCPDGFQEIMPTALEGSPFFKTECWAVQDSSGITIEILGSHWDAVEFLQEEAWKFCFDPDNIDSAQSTVEEVTNS